MVQVDSDTGLYPKCLASLRRFTFTRFQFLVLSGAVFELFECIFDLGLHLLELRIERLDQLSPFFDVLSESVDGCLRAAL